MFKLLELKYIGIFVKDKTKTKIGKNKKVNQQRICNEWELHGFIAWIGHGAN